MTGIFQLMIGMRGSSALQAEGAGYLARDMRGLARGEWPFESSGAARLGFVRSGRF